MLLSAWPQGIFIAIFLIKLIRIRTNGKTCKLTKIISNHSITKTKIYPIFAQNKKTFLWINIQTLTS